MMSNFYLGLDQSEESDKLISLNIVTVHVNRLGETGSDCTKHLNLVVLVSLIIDWVLVGTHRSTPALFLHTLAKKCRFVLVDYRYLLGNQVAKHFGKLLSLCIQLSSMRMRPSIYLLGSEVLDAFSFVEPC